MDLSPQARLLPLTRVAILIDGDNIPRTDLHRVEDAGAKMGRVALRRVFADISLRKDWACETGYLITHCTTRNGKNRADMQMTITALDIAHRGLATGFIIASDDSDFEPLIAYLTEQGFSALRVRKAGSVVPKPEPGPSAAIEATPLLAPPEPPKPDPMPVDQTLSGLMATPAQPSVSQYIPPEQFVRLIIAQSADKKVPIASLNVALRGFRISDTPEKGWRNWLLARGFVCDPKGPNACVRLGAQARG